MREKFTTGSVPFRKAYLQSLIETVEVDDRHIRIRGTARRCWNVPVLPDRPPVNLVRR
jgi:hypothetical protein